MDRRFDIISQNIMPQQDIKVDMIKINVTQNGTQRSTDIHQDPTLPFNSIEPHPISNWIALYHSEF